MDDIDKEKCLGENIQWVGIVASLFIPQKLRKSELIPSLPSPHVLDLP